MAKFKSELSVERMKNEMRNVEVEINFTSNALASILYRQGETVILACVTKADSLPRWFPRDATKGWVHAEYSLLPHQQILDSEEKETVQRVVLKRLRD